jgi:hypothetical protein
MKYSLSASMFALMFAAILLASCATKAPSPPQAAVAPAAVATPAPAPEKVAKQRTVVTKVPVLVKEASFYADGLADAYIVYKLDPDMKNVLEKDNFDTSRAEPVQRLVSEFKDGRVSAESIFESDGRLRSRRELSYDAGGRIVQERMFDGKGKLQSSSTYVYDESGKKIEWKVQDGAGSVKATSSYSYGSGGLVSVSMKDLGGKLSGTIKLQYDGDKLSKRSYFGPDGTLQKFEAYVYQDGVLAAIEYHKADGSLVSKTANSYGPMGELVKATEYDAKGAAGGYTTYEYQVREDSRIETYYE